MTKNLLMTPIERSVTIGQQHRIEQQINSLADAFKQAELEGLPSPCRRYSNWLRASLQKLDQALDADAGGGSEALGSRLCPGCGGAADRIRRTTRYKCSFCGFVGKWPRGRSLIDLQAAVESIEQVIHDSQGGEHG